MKLPVEKWIEEQSFDSETNELFKESILCYKVGAYRAAYIFSYLAFLTEIKKRILKSHLPDGVPASYWDSLRAGLQNDDEWEKRLLDALANTAVPVFKISEETRTQFRYWKDRRNDCVHFKNTSVDASFVETFWRFVQFYNRKVVVLGGKRALLNEFEAFFDVTLTAPGSDIKPLIKKIPQSLSEPEIRSFFEELLETIKDVEDFAKVLTELWALHEPTTQKAIVDFLVIEENEIRLMDFVLAKPEHLHGFVSRPDIIRKVWYSLLFGGDENPFPVLGFILRNGLCQESEKEEIIELILSENSWWKHGPSMSDLPDFQRIGLGVALWHEIEPILDPENYKVINKYAAKIVFGLRYFGAPKEALLTLNQAMKSDTPPWRFENVLDTAVSNDPTFGSRVLEQAANYGIKLCQNLEKRLLK